MPDMKSVAYVAHLEEGPESGVGKKVISQAAALALELGACVLYVLSTESGEHEAEWKAISQPGLDVRTISIGKSILSRHILSFRLLPALMKQRPDIGYFRYLHFYLGIYLCIRLFRFVFEVNSDDLSELRRSRAVWLYQKMTRGFYLRNVAGLVFVSEQIGRLPSYVCYKKKSIVIGNGYDDTHVDWDGLLRPQPEIDNFFSKYPHNVFFLGSSSQVWQGVDKIVAMAGQLPDVGFHLVGDVTLGEEVPANVHLYGYLPLSRYQYLIARCDVAIGPLALHRKNMSGTSALKVAEYVMFRKPVILAYEESDLPPDADFILRLDNTESNVTEGLRAINDFIISAKHLSVPDSLVQAMSMRNKNKMRADFLMSILDSVA